MNLHRLLLVAFIFSCWLAHAADADFTLTNLTSFNGANGASPLGGLLADSSGNLYSTTYRGGGNGFGTVFEISPSYLSPGRTFTTIAAFTGGSGANLSNPAGAGALPYAGVVADAFANLYGTTLEGGTAGGGTVYELNAATRMLTTLASFPAGGAPRGALAIDTQGNLYGTTGNGGAYGAGSIFKIDAGTHALTTLFSLNPADEGGVGFEVAVDGQGNLYGTLSLYRSPSGSGGAVFELPQSGQNLEILASFDAPVDPGPNRLLLDARGNVYGTTGYGGAYKAGSIFKIDGATHALTTLASFDGSDWEGPLGNPDGNFPTGALIEDSSGNLYGTTYYGGTSVLGTVFKFDAATQSLTTLVSFNGQNGANPAAGLIVDPNGNLYGTAQFGGDSNDGTVFELSLPEPASLPILAAIVFARLMYRPRGRVA